MSKVTHSIPLNTQDPRAIGGLDISHLGYDDSAKHSKHLRTHRDDYYILMILLKGSGAMLCDMETLFLSAKSILLIKPYQVHSAKQISKDSRAYFISVAPFLVPENCVAIFNTVPTLQQHLKIPRGQIKNIVTTCALFKKTFDEQNDHKTIIMHSLFSALIYQIAALFLQAEKKTNVTHNQSQVITQNFKRLLSEHSFLQPPSFFAEKLNITTSHLNDCVKSTAGLSVTHVLQQSMILEAKRNLYYTNNDVKRVAYSLGFEDHAYFSRLFKKITKETPLEFRNRFRE